MHERFDWKVWNFFLALLPAVALYTTMTYARKDMDRLIEEDKSFMVSSQSSSSSSSSSLSLHFSFNFFYLHIVSQLLMTNNLSKLFLNHF